MKMIEFTSRGGEPTLIDPEEIVVVRQAGGDWAGSAIIGLRPSGGREEHRCLEVVVKESSAQVRDKLAAHRPDPITNVAYAEGASLRHLGARVSILTTQGWQPSGDVQLLEMVATGVVDRLYVQAMVRYDAQGSEQVSETT